VIDSLQQVLARSVAFYRAERERAGRQGQALDPAVQRRLLDLARSIGTALCSLPAAAAAGGAPGGGGGGDRRRRSGSQSPQWAAAAQAGSVYMTSQPIVRSLGEDGGGGGGGQDPARAGLGGDPHFELDTATGKFRSRF
jgi:hypothetical protein